MSSRRLAVLALSMSTTSGCDIFKTGRTRPAQAGAFLCAAYYSVDFTTHLHHALHQANVTSSHQILRPWPDLAPGTWLCDARNTPAGFLGGPYLDWTGLDTPCPVSSCDSCLLLRCSMEP